MRSTTRELEQGPSAPQQSKQRLKTRENDAQERVNHRKKPQRVTWAMDKRTTRVPQPMTTPPATTETTNTTENDKVSRDATMPEDTINVRTQKSGQRRNREPIREGTRRIVETDTLQLTDDTIEEAQKRSRLVQKMLKDGKYKGMTVKTEYGLVLITTPSSLRIVLPPELWPLVFKDNHDSIWAGHLRAPHTYARIAQLYYWPYLQREVRRWVAGCQECGSRKARPRDVVPPLRSMNGGDVGDRWALDVPGPLPQTGGGQLYIRSSDDGGASYFGERRKIHNEEHRPEIWSLSRTTN
ncbi:hypothetical protein L916_21834 [Phytophthora nicotianae]|uniref:Integrase zinc-binding domain-containing protein n=1 Tax=Phytophthora nicotianae TaxID=4792 RepID=W2HQB4_PHYNI|nr:hypothetical protein L916_21834 [Phytophthora nicotianae]